MDWINIISIVVIIGLVFVLVIGLGWFFIGRKNQNQPPRKVPQNERNFYAILFAVLTLIGVIVKIIRG